MRPNTNTGNDWRKIHQEWTFATDAELLTCEETDARFPNTNILHLACQFNTTPQSGPLVTTDLTLYREVVTGLVAVYKKHDALDWRGCQNNDTALAKACSSGNDLLVRLLVEAGASAPPLGYSNGSPPVC